MACEGCKKRKEKIKRVIAKVLRRPEPQVNFSYDEESGIVFVSREDYAKLSEHWRIKKP
jgi:hypothetical protein